MRKVCAKMVPKNLIWAEGQSDRCVSWSSGSPWEGARILHSHYHRWWIMDFGVWPPRQNAKVGSGTLQTLPVPRKQKWANPKSNLWSFVFLTVRGSSTRNLCHQDKLSIKLFIGKSLKDSGKGWHAFDQALNALGCCTTTMPHVTRQSPSMNFWQKKTFLWFLSPPICRISVPVTSSYSPGSKTTWKGAILVLWKISRRV